MLLGLLNFESKHSLYFLIYLSRSLPKNLLGKRENKQTDCINTFSVSWSIVTGAFSPWLKLPKMQSCIFFDIITCTDKDLPPNWIRATRKIELAGRFNLSEWVCHLLWNRKARWGVVRQEIPLTLLYVLCHCYLSINWINSVLSLHP